MATKYLRFLGLLFLVVLLTGPGLNIASAQEVVVEPAGWDEQSRFTVLLLGMDRRPGARDTLRARTDVLMLLSIDPVTQSVGMLHIPRDVHMSAPGVEAFSRVNTLMIIGEERQEGYGPYYVMTTLEYNLGLYIDRYIAVDFEAFIALVDALGGVEITTTYTIDDPLYPDMNYGFDPFYLPAGTHLLDGRDALRFARTRHGDNDFIRGMRQMHVITALHDRIANDLSLPDLIAQAPTLLQALRGNIYTDLTLDEMIQLGVFAVQLPTENIQTGSLSGDYLMLYPLPGGTMAMIPDRSKTVELMRSVFGDDYAQ